MSREKEAVIVLDCGATNIRAMAVSREGKVLASKAYPNQTKSDPHFKKGLINLVKLPMISEYPSD